MRSMQFNVISRTHLFLRGSEFHLSVYRLRILSPTKRAALAVCCYKANVKHNMIKIISFYPLKNTTKKQKNKVTLNMGEKLFFLKPEVHIHMRTDDSS